MPIISALPNLPSEHEQLRRLDDLEDVNDQLEVLPSDVEKGCGRVGIKILDVSINIYPMIPFTKMATVMLVSRNLGDRLCVKHNLANI